MVFKKKNEKKDTKKLARQLSKERTRLLRERSKLYRKARSKISWQHMKFTASMVKESVACFYRLRKIFGKGSRENQIEELLSLANKPLSTMGAEDINKSLKYVKAANVLENYYSFSIEKHRVMVEQFERFEELAKDLAFKVPAHMKSTNAEKAKRLKKYEQDTTKRLEKYEQNIKKIISARKRLEKVKTKLN